jgi:hypothetical protein
MNLSNEEFRRNPRRSFFRKSVSWAGTFAVAATVLPHTQSALFAQDPAASTPFERDYDAPSFKPSWKKSQINRLLAQDFIIFAHSDLEMTKKLLEREPGLINASIDWGAGDWETALGGASHMGRHDIVEFLLSRGARIDIFCAAMQGQTEAVRSFLNLQPTLIDAKGPHGFDLQSVKEVELKPIPFLKKPPSNP